MYMHLVKKPSRANLIKYIHLECHYFSEFTLLLLRLAITPSIERIASNVRQLDIRFYQTLAEIAGSFGVKLERLKSVPWPVNFTDTHYRTALLLKDSLEEMIIPPNIDDRPDEISKHLGEFKCLSKLQVDCVFDNLPQVESIFRGAGNLMQVGLRNCYFNNWNVWPYQERIRWMKQHVQVKDNPITLNALDEQNLGISLIEYFLFKYPHIKQFYYIANEFGDMGFEQEVDLDVEIDRQACLLISKIPSYALDLSLDYAWRTHYGSFAGDKNVFHLHYGDAFELSRYKISSIVDQNGKRSTEFEFSNGVIFEEGGFDTHTIPFLNEIGTFTTHMHMNFDVFDEGIDSISTVESKVFFKSLEVFKRLEEMSFVSSNILVSVNINLSSQYSKRRLNTLKILGTQIQPAMFHTLDQLFHTISTLTLSCCLITKDQTNTICIHMPSTALGRLILTTELDSAASPYYRYYFRDTISLITNDTYLMTNLQRGVTLYFKLSHFLSNVRQISFAEYFSRPRQANAFSIYCQLLASIELNLGGVYTTIDVQKYSEALAVVF